MKLYKLTYAVAFAFTILTAQNVLGQPTPGVFEIRFSFDEEVVIDADFVTPQQQAELAPSLAETKSFWESVIVGYQPGVTLDGIDIEISVEPDDGPGGTLASAGPGGFIVNQGGFIFFTDDDLNSSAGQMSIDSADLSTSLIVDVLNHEVAHTLGFGTLFDRNGLADNTGQYNGQEGLLAYQAEFDALAQSIPLENDNGHYLESNGLTDVFGRVMGDELMTPFIENTTNANDPSSNFLSLTTVGVLRDLGYNAIAPIAIPEPSSLALLALGGLALCGRRR